ncbi:MAG: Dna2/Cas4 domain-containing protein [Anaerolineae bacterium]|nr:Dna2/Cas4 domain-containing protein [Anaerolineae bacterium]RIK15561.1 MAG: CRISPR-associated protein Cas4 [Anaerolineae bacterium]
MMMSGLPLILVLGLLFLAALFWFRGRNLREESGLPAGNVIYTDTGTWRANSAVLHAAHLRLAGKPDYLVEQRDGSIIPVEIKSSLAPNSPWDGQVLQLAAYCALVETNYGVRPPYGILQYKDRAFAVDFTDDLEADLLDLLDEMRQTSADPDPEPDHGDRRRCLACGVREACGRRLA